jgi:hypothetical protein
MKPSRMMWVFFVYGGVLGGGRLPAAPPEPIQPGQKVFTLSPVPLQVQTETQAVVGPAVELVAEHVQNEWVWVTVRGWVRSSLVQLPPGGLLQSGQMLTIRSEAPLQVESETRAVVLPRRKVIFEQAQGDWLWVAVQGWCQAQYLTKESPATWQTAPPPTEQSPQEPTRYYYYYYYDSSPYWYRSYPYRYYYDRYWPGYYRYWPRPWIDIDIDVYRYWPPDRYRPKDRDHRPPDWDHRPGDRDRWPDRPPYRPDGSHRPDGPSLHPYSKLDGGPKPTMKSDPTPKLPSKLEPAPKAPGKPTPSPKPLSKTEWDISAPKAPGKPTPSPKPLSKTEWDISASKAPGKPTPSPKPLSKTEWDISTPKAPGKPTPEPKIRSKTEPDISSP